MLLGSVDTYPQLLGSRIIRITRGCEMSPDISPRFQPVNAILNRRGKSEIVLAAKLRVFNCTSINNAKCQQNLILILNDLVLLS